MNEHIHSTAVPHDENEKRKLPEISKMDGAEFLWMSCSAVVMGMGIYMLPLVTF